MKYLGSKTIETDRLVLKAQTMNEKKYLWSVLMIPEVNRYYLTVPKKFSEKLKDWSKQEEYYKADMEHANDLDIFRWSIFLKESGECIGRVSCHEANAEDNNYANTAYQILSVDSSQQEYDYLFFDKLGTKQFIGGFKKMKTEQM